jgi:hypothetical protein
MTTLSLRDNASSHSERRNALLRSSVLVSVTTTRTVHCSWLLERLHDPVLPGAADGVLLVQTGRALAIAGWLFRVLGGAM